MTIWTYVRDLTSVFFKWWWAAIIGIATILSFVGVPSQGINLSKFEVSLLVFILSLLLFFTGSVLIQGYKWYNNYHNLPEVEACIPAVSETEKEVFTIRSMTPLEPGQVITVLRTTNRGTGCLGIIKVERVLEPLRYQCSPLWIAPHHKNDLAQNHVQVSQLKATLLLTETDLLSFASEARSL